MPSTMQLSPIALGFMVCGPIWRKEKARAATSWVSLNSSMPVPPSFPATL